MKCDICKKEIGKIFLDKIVGTFIKTEGKKKVVCSECQKRYKDDRKLKGDLK